MAQAVGREFAELLEAVPDAVVCVDGQGRITTANTRAQKLFGYVLVPAPGGSP